MRHQDWSNPFPFHDQLLQVFIPKMCYNYRIENRALEEPAAILLTSATKKDGFRLPRSGCLGTPLTLPQSLYGRTYADVRTKIFRINGLPNLLTHGAPRAPLKIEKNLSAISDELLSWTFLFTDNAFLRTINPISGRHHVFTDSSFLWTTLHYGNPVINEHPINNTPLLLINRPLFTDDPNKKLS